MEFIEVLRECQGEQTQQAFADRLGLTQAQVSRLLAGKARPGLRTLRALWRTYPDKREALVFFHASQLVQEQDVLFANNVEATNG